MIDGKLSFQKESMCVKVRYYMHACMCIVYMYKLFLLIILYYRKKC